MRNKLLLSAPARITIISLIVATIGVIIQIMAKVNYPKVPPVFFILLIPAALLYFTPWRWTPVSAVIAGIFLTVGLFSSGASIRLLHFQNPGGSIGLWVQMLAVLVALIAAMISTYWNYRRSNQGEMRRA